MAASIAATALSGLGCDPEPVDPDDDTQSEQDFRASDKAAYSLAGTPRFATISALFRVDALVGTDWENENGLRRFAVGAAHTRFATLNVFDCAPELTTDNDTFIRVVMNDCRFLGLWEVEAELEAVARVEDRVVIWELDITDVAMGVVGLPRSHFMGPMELRLPLTPGVPNEWETLPGFVLENRKGERFDTLSTAQWTEDDDRCVTIDVGARLSPEQAGDELDEEIGDLVVSVRGVQRCPGACAHAGDVELSFGLGDVLRWSHDGSNSITVRGPQGREFDVTLPCAEE